MSPGSKSAVLPEQFGPYRIVRPLGKGGMGAVYLARDTRIDRDVALKVCHLTDNPKAQERFRREAKAAAGLSHPNLCPLYEFDVREGIAYLTMAFIDGPSLTEWVAERGGLSQREAALMVAKLAMAMQEAHEAGVIHRDLKPGNIVINKKGEPVILDFGLARQLNATGTRVTQLGAICGTPSYMAPEQATGDTAAIGTAADVYSLGVILYELLTGHVPFEGPTYSVLAQLVRALPVPPRTHNAAVDEILEATCLKALAKNPAGRHESMKELAQDLARTARSLPSSVTPANVRVSTTAASMATSPDVSAQRTAPTLRAAPAPRRGTGRTGIAVAVGVLLLSVLGGGAWYGVGAWRERQQRPVENAGKVGDGDSIPPPQPSPEPLPRDVKPPPQPVVNSVGMTFVHLPKGTFYMGGGGGAAGQRKEIAADFEIAIHPVTQGQWEAVMPSKPTCFSRSGLGKDAVKDVADADLKQFPVEMVSWNDAQEFIKKLNDREHGRGWTYRLPTEAEWEYACRGGATSQADCSFHFYLDKPTNDLSAKDANIDGEYPVGNAPKVKTPRRPTPVGSYQPNRLGLYDMHGNVWQWCDDSWTPGSAGRVMRGGAWSRFGSFAEASSRLGFLASARFNNTGFRLVRAPAASTPPPAPPTKEIVNSIGMTLVYIKPGTFTMGSPTTEPSHQGDEAPRSVTLKEGFFMAATLVSQQQWKLVMGADNNPSRFKGDDLPVDSVSWIDAKTFCLKLSAQDGLEYNLPHEEMWEFAARAGTTTPFWQGDSITTEQANFNGVPYRATDPRGVGRAKTMPAKYFKPNPWGLHDMGGNLWQWCEDRYGGPALPESKVPIESEVGKHHVVRGGSWLNDAWLCRAARRIGVDAGKHSHDVGFRVMVLASAGVPVRITVPKIEPVLATKEITNSIGTRLMYIAPGTFLMGSPATELKRMSNEAQHKVTLTKAFYLGATPVTQKEWKAVMGSSPTVTLVGDDLPVTNVSWNDCQDYCRKLSATEGKTYRLPTEAEWEYACRAGTTTPFWTGETITTDQANFKGNIPYRATDNKGISKHSLTPVMEFKANAWGLHDMHGNVFQWCQDGFGEYDKGDTKDPLVVVASDTRVLRGGSYASTPQMCRAAFRHKLRPTLSYAACGFRIAMSAD